jgi:hypothetical protein
MSIKIFCDKENCKEEINQSDGGGTVVIITKETTFDMNSKQMTPKMKQQEFQVCSKHAKEILDYLKKVEEK